MSVPNTRYATPSAISCYSSGGSYCPEDLEFSPFHQTNGLEVSPPQAQIISDTHSSPQAGPDLWLSGYPADGLLTHNSGDNPYWFSVYPVHGLPLQNPGYHPECPTPERPFSAQPGEEPDYKLSPHILENMDNSQLLGEHLIYYGHTSGLKFRYDQLEKLNQILNEEKVEQNGKLKAQEEEVEKLQIMVKERDNKIRMHEKKERAHLKKRKGKNPFGRSRIKK
jgi:hypothetical protein